jgi:hypothetical protein
MPVTTSYAACRMLKKTVQQGRSKRSGEAYVRYVEPLNAARTPLAGFFSILLLAEAVWQTCHMHLKLTPRHIIDVATQGVFHHGECDLVPRNGGE